MLRKVIIDSDMGTDDAVALCMALFDERLDILAITATEGCVNAEQANHNLQAIIAELDPARYPRLGMACCAEDAPPLIRGICTARMDWETPVSRTLQGSNGCIHPTR